MWLATTSIMVDRSGLAKRGPALVNGRCGTASHQGMSPIAFLPSMPSPNSLQLWSRLPAGHVQHSSPLNGDLRPNARQSGQWLQRIGVGRAWYCCAVNDWVELWVSLCAPTGSHGILGARKYLHIQLSLINHSQHHVNILLHQPTARNYTACMAGHAQATFNL